MVFFKKQKIWLQAFLIRHGSNRLITEATHLTVGIINIVWFLLVALVVTIPLGFFIQHAPVTTCAICLFLAIAYLVGSISCIEIKTNKKYESPTK